MKDLFARLKAASVHVSLEKDDLKVKFNGDSLPADLVAEIKQNKEQIIDYLKNTVLSETDYEPIPNTAVRQLYDLSSSQSRLWVLCQDEASNMAYNIFRVESLEGALDLEVLNLAFYALIERHESLRTVFRLDESGEAKQCIRTMAEQSFALNYQDLRGNSGSGLIEQLITRDQSTPFDLTSDCLLRVSIYQVEAERYIFSYVIHHIISDGWSLHIMIKELLSLYAAFMQGQKNPLAPLRIQYKDYAAWQQGLLQNDTMNRHRDYWLSQLGGELPVLELHGDRPRPAIKTFNGNLIRTNFDKQLTNSIKQLCQAQGGTLFMGLLAGVNALLYKYTGQNDLIVGSPIAGRDHADLEDQLGFYLNTLALRTRFNSQQSFADLFNEVKKTTLEAYEHQAYPFDKLVENLKLNRDMSRSALFDVMIVLQNTEIATGNKKPAAGPNANASQKAGNNAKGNYTISKFDLAFEFVELDEQLTLLLEYNSDMYDADSIHRMIGHLEQVFKTATASPAAALDEINCLGADEREQLLVQFNNTASSYPENSTLAQLFEEQAKAVPDNTALVFEGTELSYQQLNERSNQLAAYLKEKYNIQTDDLVAIKTERSEWAVIALLAILKAGGAYVPIDPEYPQDRMDYIVEDTRCRIVIDAAELERFEAAKDAYSTQNISTAGKATDLAYVTYTSGSTGQPKGVMVEQRSVARLVKNCNYIRLSESDRILSLSSFSFDGSVFDIFGALLNGATLVITSKKDITDPKTIGAIIETKKITAFFITTALFNLLVDHDFENFEKLRYVLFGGEQVSVNHVRKFRERYSNVNLCHVYGPTENTTFSSWYPVRTVKENAYTIPIGQGISNTTCYILNSNNQLQPIGVPGEIYVGGDGLARGYLNNEAATREKFVAHPFSKGERLYKTGDLAKWLADGSIEFIGRNDGQVKIRGHRIEPGEIENALLKNPSVKEAVVIPKTGKDGEKRLIAYLVGQGELTLTDVTAQLKSNLPAYMIPALFVQLDALPLNSNGKVDKKYLLSLEGTEILTTTEYVAPRNDIEEQLATIWAEMLGLEKEKIGIHDNFFDLGGHSLKAIRLINRINKEFGLSYNMRGLYVESTIALIAEKLRIDLHFKASEVNDDNYTEIKI